MSTKRTAIINIAGMTGGAVLACAAAIAGSTILGVAPWAHADNGAFSGPKGDHDPAAFWVDATSAGVSGTLADGAALAEAICRGLENGESEGQAIMVGMKATDISLGAARFVVHAAEWHYCSDLY